MAIAPLVRYILPCEDWTVDPTNDRKVSIIGLLSNIDAFEGLPLLYRELCIFVVLTDGHGRGQGKIVCVKEETNRAIFVTRNHTIEFVADPLEVIGVPFRILDCRFPETGLYTLQFWFDNQKLAESPLRIR